MDDYSKYFLKKRILPNLILGIIVISIITLIYYFI